MKKLLLFLLIIISQVSFAQIPQSFKYQAVVRDATGLLAVNKIVSIRTSILAGSATGSSAYTETQTLSSNDYGVVALNIGAGTLVFGNFSTINWGATAYFVKTELDINGGSTYVFMGTSQVLSVPYALYSEKSGSSFADHDTSATNELQNLSIAGKNVSISSGNTIALPQDSLSIAGHVLGITNGNTVNLPPLQTISIVGDSLHISNSNAVYLSGSVDLDASPTNELQNLTLNNDTLKISMGNQVVFPHDNDRDSLNEIQNLSIVGHILTLSQGNSIIVPPDADSSITNEIQTLSINLGVLSISNSNSVTLPDNSSTNELQNLSISHDSITITQGNTVYINTTRSLKFPEGIDGIPIMIKDKSGFPQSYTVPSGKNLYVTNQWNNGQGPMYGFPVFISGTTLNFTNNEILFGILVNQNPEIQIINTTVTTSTGYTVPIGKTLYVKSFEGNSFQANFTNPLDDVAFNTTEVAEVLIFTEGTIIKNSSNMSNYFTGYLK